MCFDGKAHINQQPINRYRLATDQRQPSTALLGQACCWEDRIGLQQRCTALLHTLEVGAMPKVRYHLGHQWCSPHDGPWTSMSENCRLSKATSMFSRRWVEQQAVSSLRSQTNQTSPTLLECAGVKTYLKRYLTLPN